MKTLAAVFTAIGALVGLGVGILEHHRSSPARTGWTFYLPQQTRFADYLPGRAPWWPGLAEYIGVGVVGGAVVAAVLLAVGFRLSRVPVPAS